MKFFFDDRTDTNFIAPFRMHFQRSKSTLDSPKSVFNILRRKQLGVHKLCLQLGCYQKTSQMVVELNKKQVCQFLGCKLVMMSFYGGMTD